MRFLRINSLCLRTMAPFNKDDKVLMKPLCEQKGYDAGQFVTKFVNEIRTKSRFCLLYTSPSPRD